jgi:diguanylate cyclase (GGDEF)-like protein
MSRSIAITTLLRRFMAPAKAAPNPTSIDARDSMLDAVVMRLRGGPELAVDSAQALDSLHGLLLAERQAHVDAVRRLTAAQGLLAATQTALTASRRRERLAQHSALHDSLTALPNRAFFRSRLDEALRQAARDGALAVLVLDLDGFKPINDTHGHAAGDEVLKVVAARLSHAVRGSDWVARLGGDEFACVLNGVVERERLRSLAAALVEKISEPIALGTLRVSVRASIGIALHHSNVDDDIDSEMLIRRADAAMFAAKRARSGPTFCDGCAR